MRAGCWSHALKTNSVIQRDPSLHLQSSAAHSNRLQVAAPKSRHGKESRPYSRRHALTQILWSDVCMGYKQDKPGVLCRATLGTRGNGTVQSWQDKKSWVTVSSTSEINTGGENWPSSALHTHTHTLMHNVASASNDTLGFSEWGREGRRVEGSRSIGQPVERKSPSAAQANYIPPLLN